MNRYWTEVVNLNIGKNKNYKMSQIVLELASGTICAYPGGDLLSYVESEKRKMLKKKLKNLSTYTVIRDQEPLLNSGGKGKFMDYIAPIYQGNKNNSVVLIGQITIHLKQDYSDLVP